VMEARGGVSGARRWINGAGGGRPPIELGFWGGDDKGGHWSRPDGGRREHRLRRGWLAGPKGWRSSGASQWRREVVEFDRGDNEAHQGRSGPRTLCILFGGNSKGKTEGSFF
jgi:hypothetical protein